MIAGAGIGGLTTALRLHHLGIDCEVRVSGSSRHRPVSHPDAPGSGLS
jgi:2-polyprenyl-6-methoxyphenol hydroxylase-like FAD-dependent oxidoreductase